jgi:phospholipid transport system substrate-binding protein
MFNWKASMFKLNRIVAGPLAAFIALAAAFSAQAEEVAPDELVRRTTNEVLNIIRNDKDLAAGDNRKIVQLAEEKVLPNFNFSRMTQLAVGRAWRDASDAQKEALTKEFRTLLVRTYSTSLASYRNQTIEVKPLKVAAGEKEVVVKTVINQPGGQPIPIDYSMEKTDKGWKAYDIVVDSVSLVTNYRSTFAEEVRKAGIDGLIKTLADRNTKAQNAPAKK